MAAALQAPFVVIYLTLNGQTPWSIAVYFMLVYGSETVFVLLITRVVRPGIRQMGVLSMLAGTLFFLSLGLLNGRGWLLVLIPPILYAAAMVLFWIPFNILIIRTTKKQTRGLVLSVSFLLFPVLMAIAPAVAGAVVTWFGYPALWVLCGSLLVVDAVFIYFLKGFSDSWIPSMSFSLHKLDRTLHLGFIGSGGQEGIFAVAMPLMSFGFAKTEMGLGILISAFAIVGAFAAVGAGYMSDRLNNRTRFIRAAALASVPFILVAAFSSNMWVYSIAMGLTFATIPMVNIFLFAKMTDDNEQDPMPSIMSREVALNVGRLLGAAVVFVLAFLIGLEAAMASAAVLICLCLFVK